MESFAVPSLWVEAMPRGTGRGSLEPFCPQGLPAEAGGARGQHPGRGARNAPAGQTCLGGQGKGAPHGTPKAAGAASSSASSPPCPCSSARDGPSWLQATASVGSELPARTIYRPWFSPYSYFIRSAAAPQQHLSSSLATGTQEPEEADRLSETICSSSCSSEDPQPSQRGRQNSGRVSITVRDILAAARGQPVPQQGYKCRACCRVFPTLWAVKTHIQHSSQEGYSCKAYYRKLKVLLEKESQEQEGPPAPQ
ncbi:spermatogenesis-associated protein 46 [Anas platyrhynchos]|uniref:spermatogenesis-associated protein 46 n=1 Tax=Anas platyrhynchos TaxID=8839 RepID=UPI003AF240D0